MKGSQAWVFTVERGTIAYTYRGVRISEASSVFSVGAAMRTCAVGRVPELSLAVHLRERANPNVLGLPPPFYCHCLYTPLVHVIAKFWKVLEHQCITKETEKRANLHTAMSLLVLNTNLYIQATSLSTTQLREQCAAKANDVIPRYHFFLILVMSLHFSIHQIDNKSSAFRIVRWMYRTNRCSASSTLLHFCLWEKFEWV